VGTVKKDSDAGIEQRRRRNLIVSIGNRGSSESGKKERAKIASEKRELWREGGSRERSLGGLDK